MRFSNRQNRRDGHSIAHVSGRLMNKTISVSMTEERASMNKYQKVWLALSGFMGGIGFTMIAFHFNHKNILDESLYFWSAVFMVSLGFCLNVILKKDI